MSLNPTPQEVLGYRVFSMAQYQQTDDIKDREIFLIYIKDFVSPDEYVMKSFDGKKEYKVETNQEQLDANNLTVLDFIQLSVEDIQNRMSL